MERRLHRWVLALATLFVFAQTAGLLHAEIHPFHEHTADCDVYDKLAQPVSDLVPAVSAQPSVYVRSAAPAVAKVDPLLAVVALFESRAPPSA